MKVVLGDYRNIRRIISLYRMFAVLVIFQKVRKFIYFLSKINKSLNIGLRCDNTVTGMFTTPVKPALLLMYFSG